MKEGNRRKDVEKWHLSYEFVRECRSVVRGCKHWTEYLINPDLEGTVEVSGPENFAATIKKSRLAKSQGSVAVLDMMRHSKEGREFGCAIVAGGDRDPNDRVIGPEKKKKLEGLLESQFLWIGDSGASTHMTNVWEGFTHVWKSNSVAILHGNVIISQWRKKGYGKGAWWNMMSKIRKLDPRGRLYWMMCSISVT